jgi:hypothetical protein
VPLTDLLAPPGNVAGVPHAFHGILPGRVYADLHRDSVECERSPAFRFIIYIGQSMNGLIDAAQFRDCLREFGGSISDLQRSHHRHCLHDAEFERAGKSEHVVPVLLDQFRIDPMACDAIQKAVVRCRLDSPIAGTANIRNAR